MGGEPCALPHRGRRYRLGGDKANAGVQFRTARIPNDHEVIGYHADMGRGGWGALYDDSRPRAGAARAETDATVPARGVICVKIHSGPPSEAWYRDITLTELKP